MPAAESAIVEIDMPPEFYHEVEDACRKSLAAYDRGVADAQQDICENVPFASVGSMTAMRSPSYIDVENAEAYLRGYSVVTFAAGYGELRPWPRKRRQGASVWDRLMSDTDELTSM